MPRSFPPFDWQAVARSGFVILVIGSILVSTVGCGNSGQDELPRVVRNDQGAKGGADVRNGGGSLPFSGTGDPTEEQAIDLALQYEEALQQGNRGKLNVLMAWDVIVAKAFVGVEFPRGTYDRQLQEGIQSSQQNFYNALMAFWQRPEANNFEFLRVSQRNNRRSILFRLIYETGAFGYIEFELANGFGPGKNQAKIVEIYNYAVGENTSKMMNDTMVTLMAKTQKQSFLDRLTGREKKLAELGNSILEFQTAAKSNNYARAKSLFQSLPVDVQTERFILIKMIQCTAAQPYDQEYYLDLLDLWDRTYPNDPSQMLLTIDSAYMRGEFDLCLEKLDQLDQAVGGDPYIEAYRASIAVERDEGEAACAGLRAKIQAHPECYQLVDLLLAFCLDLDDPAQTVADLSLIEQVDEALIDTDILEENFPSKPVFQSEEYQHWKALH